MRGEGCRYGGPIRTVTPECSYPGSSESGLWLVACGLWPAPLDSGLRRNDGVVSVTSSPRSVVIRGPPKVACG